MVSEGGCTTVLKGLSKEINDCLHKNGITELAQRDDDEI